MFKPIRAVIIATLILQTINPLANSAGRTNQSIANTILNGKGAPNSSIGINGDFYIDISTFNMYGPKTKNRWPAPISLRSSANSSERTTTVAGSPGEKGEKGSKGEKGESGAQGAQGAKGEKGESGAKGEAGAKGDAGAKGETGAKGDTGLKGDKGDKGEKGDTGEAGPAGPSNAYAGSISFANALHGSGGTSQSSSNFGNLKSGKSYVFDIVIWAYGGDDNPHLNFSVSAIGATPRMSTIWLRSVSNTYRGNIARTEQAFIGKVSIDGSDTITDFQLAVTVATGLAIAAPDQITLSGGYSGQLIGNVST